MNKIKLNHYPNLIYVYLGHGVDFKWLNICRVKFICGYEISVAHACSV